MAEFGSWLRRTGVLCYGALLALDPFSAAGQPAMVNPRWNVSFQNEWGEAAGISNASPVGDKGLLVCVAGAGTVPATFRLRHGGVEKAAELAGYDPVSGLCFIRPGEAGTVKRLPWVDGAAGKPGAVFHASAPSGDIRVVSQGWVKQIGGKVLPLALLRFDFHPTVPPPGTPVFDASNQVVALVFEGNDGTKSGYGLPAEAVLRVHRDIAAHGKPVRAWLGLSLLAESRVPKVVRVLPGSPAAAAGVRADDVLLSIGTMPLLDYSDVSNAFFYLIPGRQVEVKVLRGEEPLDILLTPTDEKPR